MAWQMVLNWAKDRNGQWYALNQNDAITSQDGHAYTEYDIYRMRIESGPQAAKQWLKFERPQMDAVAAAVTWDIWDGRQWVRQYDKTRIVEFPDTTQPRYPGAW